MKNNRVSICDIDAFLFDFDGVLSDNMVYVSEDGKEWVTCSRSDGLAFDALKKLQDEDRIAFRYVNNNVNPNGSTDRIAGILNNKRNILGMMPHPERAAESILGSEDGLKIFKSILGKS